MVRTAVWKVFIAWTALFWGGTAALGALFFAGVVEFETSTRVSLYGTSVWLNGCLWPLVMGGALRQRFHEVIVLWVISYCMTNALWEIPWVLTSPFIFDDLHSLDDVVARTDWMRQSPLHMGWWVMASFGVCDLRTVNHDSTFYALGFMAFLNVAGAALFYRLNQQRHPLRYLVVLVGSGEPIASTFIFSFSEVFGGFANMPGGPADTLLALVWTQYQYILFPALTAWMAGRLMFDE